MLNATLNNLFGWSRLPLRRERKRFGDLFPDVVEAIATHVVDLSLFPTLFSHVLLISYLLGASRLAQCHLSQGTGDARLQFLTGISLHFEFFTDVK